MHNLGRGMWRRLNDYEVGNQMRIKNAQLQEYLAYKEYQLKLKKQLEIKAYRDKILEEKRRERELEQLEQLNQFNQLNQENIMFNGIIESVYFETTTEENDIPIEISLEETLLEELCEEKKEETYEDKIIVKEVLEESKNDNKFVPKKLKKKNKKILI
jgi:hypothetical protein